MRAIFLTVFMVLSMMVISQTYFPPTTGGEWEQSPYSSVDWCAEKVDSLHQFLNETNAKAFIYLKDGRIIDEVYFDQFTQDSLWYWASAGKSLAAFLVGCAQEDGLIDIHAPTSDYLGEGWTSCTPEQEAEITPWHQLTMTTGLDYSVVDQNCQDPECLTYLNPPATEWYYHNAPYRLIQEVISEATSQNFNLYTFQRVGQRIGMGGLWIDQVRWGKARDLARFGLLTLNQGIWDQDTILSDTQYLSDMLSPSQDINQSYGYLWWLNTGPSFRLPQSTITFPGQLTPAAPQEVVGALGKNDQKIYVWPSEGVVVVRIGNTAGEVAAGPSSFDNELWTRLMDMSCPLSLAENEDKSNLLSYLPNPMQETLDLSRLPSDSSIEITDALGRRYISGRLAQQLSTAALPPGVYHLTIYTSTGQHSRRLIKE